MENISIGNLKLFLIGVVGLLFTVFLGGVIGTESYESLVLGTAILIDWRISCKLPLYSRLGDVVSAYTDLQLCRYELRRRQIPRASSDRPGDDRRDISERKHAYVNIQPQTYIAWLRRKENLMCALIDMH